MSKVRWGIIGAGRISHTFANDIQYAESASLVAVAARNKESAQTFADQYGIESVYQGYDLLCADEQVDAVYIATPHSFHYEQTKMALEAGKHVLCEKPFTVSSAQCEELMALARAKGLFLMEAMWTFFLPAIKQAQKWIADGRIGELKHIKADFGYPLPYDPNRREWDAELGGGCLLEMGIYPVAFNFLFNPSTDYKMHVIGKRAPNGADRDVTVTLDYGEQVSVIHTTYDARIPNWGAIVGTEGRIIIEDFFRASEASLYAIDDRVEHFVDDRKGGGFEFEIEAASRAIISGEIETAEMPLSTSLHFQKQMETILGQF